MVTHHQPPSSRLRRRAWQGDARAQYNLGGMYAEGLGVPPDAVEALMWLTIAGARSTW